MLICIKHSFLPSKALISAKQTYATPCSSPPVHTVIDELAAFKDVLARKKGVLLSHILRLFPKTNWDAISPPNNWEISNCTKVIENNYESMFRNSGFQKTEIPNTLYYGFSRIATMHLNNTTDVFRDQISILHRAEDLIFRLVGKPLCFDSTAFQTLTLHKAHFSNIHSSVREIVFSWKYLIVFSNGCNYYLPT